MVLNDSAERAFLSFSFSPSPSLSSYIPAKLFIFKNEKLYSNSIRPYVVIFTSFKLYVYLVPYKITAGFDLTYIDGMRAYERERNVG